MKDVIKRAAKFESAKSLDGYMSFLKGNVGKIHNMEKTPMTRPMPKTTTGIAKLAAAKKEMKIAKAVKTVKAIKKMSK
jgi:hypothetical protein